MQYDGTILTMAQKRNNIVSVVSWAQPLTERAHSQHANAVRVSHRQPGHGPHVNSHAPDRHLLGS